MLMSPLPVSCVFTRVTRVYLTRKRWQVNTSLCSPVGVRLGVEEQLGVAYALCRRSCQVGICQLVKVSLCQQHQAAGVVEGEEVLQMGWMDACMMCASVGVQLAGQGLLCLVAQCDGTHTSGGVQARATR